MCLISFHDYRRGSRQVARPTFDSLAGICCWLTAVGQAIMANVGTVYTPLAKEAIARVGVGIKPLPEIFATRKARYKT